MSLVFSMSFTSFVNVEPEIYWNIPDETIHYDPQRLDDEYEIKTIFVTPPTTTTHKKIQKLDHLCFEFLFSPKLFRLPSFFMIVVRLLLPVTNLCFEMFRTSKCR